MKKELRIRPMSTYLVTTFYFIANKGFFQFAIIAYLLRAYIKILMLKIIRLRSS